MKRLLAIVIAVLVFSPIAVAAPDHAHEGESAALSEPLGEATPAPNEAVVRVSGVVCSFCSQGLQKKLSKLPFVDRSKYKKGIHVSIEDQLVTIALKPDLALDLALVYDKMRSGGYEPSKAWVANAEGDIAIFDASGAPCGSDCS